MSEPIYDFLKSYSSASVVRMHMPGHKGRIDLGELDLTEIDGADDLFSPDGIIAESERRASEIFGAHTFYSTEGSSLAIRAMVRLVCEFAAERGEEPLIAAARGVHKSFVSALALTGCEVEWLLSENADYMSCIITPDFLKRYFDGARRLPTAVYLTSPSYLGKMQDISALSRICRERGVLLLVDNAHGAYLKLLASPIHPIDLGADMCADSAHKTLPALTGAAYLHISRSAPKMLAERAKSAMALFASTSPSYLIMSSLDRVNGYVEDGYPARVDATCRAVSALRSALLEHGIDEISDEPMKISIAARSIGYTGGEIAEILRSRGIYAEFYDDDHIVLMPSAESTEEEMLLLRRALLDIKRRERESCGAPRAFIPERIKSVREAVFSPYERLPLADCLGRVLSGLEVSCPPAVPIVVPGEVIDERAISLLRYYGRETLLVVKE